ncbi:hypothetical protein FAUST_9961 [Fusarium austroamericanum]|uniref:BTB domain-containing protein n=1 Tax=Fusarium austroamericanum TaxID=282268 RepID=A0AAN6BW49_FUSAU|nr:hypothetical protein FAUST_9961 [Fusarium austroamericanum]
MSHSASVSTQQGQTPPSRKPSAYVFDSNGDTRIILSTYMAQTLRWKPDKIWIKQKRPTMAYYRKQNWEKKNDCSKATDQVQDWDYGETCEVSFDKIKFRMLVSGKHLELASPIFKTMLTGPFTEGSADSSGVRRITASDWDHRALKIVLSIMHGYHRDVPRSLDFYMLVKVAMIVNYYDCLESVEVYTDLWLQHFEHSQKLIEAEDFPLPADILEEIDKARQSALAETFSAIYDLLDDLQDSYECSFECSSMLLGVLTKELGHQGALYPRAVPPYIGFSIEDSKEMIEGLQKPIWYSDPDDNSHPCCIQDRLSGSLAELESKLPAFNLQDFQSVKNHRRD